MCGRNLCPVQLKESEGLLKAKQLLGSVLAVARPQCLASVLFASFHPDEFSAQDERFSCFSLHLPWRGLCMALRCITLRL